jgi:hypothetical protein
LGDGGFGDRDRETGWLLPWLIAIAATTAAAPATPRMIRRRLCPLRLPGSPSNEVTAGWACTAIAWLNVEILVDCPTSKTTEVLPCRSPTPTVPPMQETTLSPFASNLTIAAACGAPGAARTT